MDYREYVIFRLAGESYGVDIDNVENIERHIEITRVPYTKKFIQGVINLRGNIIPVINVRKRFGIEAIEIDSDTRIMIINHNELTVGLLVDASSEVMQIGNENIEKAPVVLGGDDDFVSSIGKVDGRIIMLVELGRLLDIAELVE